MPSKVGEPGTTVDRRQVGGTPGDLGAGHSRKLCTPGRFLRKSGKVLERGEEGVSLNLCSGLGFPGAKISRKRKSCLSPPPVHTHLLVYLVCCYLVF